MPLPSSPSTGPLIPRLGNAILLRRTFYDAVATDTHATAPAGAIVCLAAIARESVNLYELSQGFRAWGLLLVLIVVFAVVRWLVYTAILYPIARAVCGEAVEFKRLLRCLGFAEAPTVVSVIGFALDERFLPWVQFGVGAWLLAATIVAVRSATRATTNRALVIGGLGFAAYLVLGVALDVVAHLPDAPPSTPSADGGGVVRRFGAVELAEGRSCLEPSSTSAPRHLHTPNRLGARVRDPLCGSLPLDEGCETVATAQKETVGWQTRRSPRGRPPNVRSCLSWRWGGHRTCSAYAAEPAARLTCAAGASPARSAAARSVSKTSA